MSDLRQDVYEHVRYMDGCDLGSITSSIQGDDDDIYEAAKSLYLDGYLGCDSPRNYWWVTNDEKP